jgi:ABC-2 type transport system ATP-binding protein
MIEVRGLTKDFGRIRAVDDLSFSVGKGEILGFLGPNGAGKSTTMKMIACFLAPTQGSITVDGISVASGPREVKEKIGYLPETSASYSDMNVEEFLRFIAEVRGYRGEEIETRVNTAISQCVLEGVRDQSIETLSKGYRQRVGFAQAILHDPPILILDEPTDGLDPNQKHEVRNLIQSMGKDKCIILSTHILEEVDAVCSRAIIISEGKIVLDGTPDEIRSRSKEYNAVQLAIHQVSQPNTLEKLESISSVSHVEAFSGLEDLVQRFKIYPRGKDSILTAVSELVKKENWSLEDLHQEKGRLDEVFRDLTSNAHKTRTHLSEGPGKINRVSATGVGSVVEDHS